MNAVLHALAPYQGAALALVSYLVASVVMGAAIFALAALVVRFWRPLDAAARYAVWYVALLGVVLGPLAALALMQPQSHPAPAQVRLALGAPPVATHPPAQLALRITRPSIAVPPWVAYGVAALWLLFVAYGIARFAAGAVVLARLKRDALPLAPDRRAALPLWRAHAGDARARRARLCVSDRVEVPVAVGLFDGMVVLPQHVLDEFEAGDVDRFVLHELSHLERRDDWTTALQRLIQVAMFFNPVVYAIARRLDLEREIACDDRVVEATSDVRSYAVGLTRMAKSTAWPHRGIAAPAIFVTRHQLSLRVEELLAGRRLAPRRIAIAPAAIALAASLGVVAVAAPLAPHIGVENAADPLARTDHVTRFDDVKFFLVDKNGKNVTFGSSHPGVKFFRGELHTVDSDGAVRVDRKHIETLIKHLEAALPAAKDGGKDHLVIRRVTELHQPLP
jgi:beta-lactamase regulating signal transducer with metallopeptidase domain